MPVIYKITRKDGQEYIGIAINHKNRFNQHRSSERFSMGIKKIEILEEVDDYKKAEKLEEYYIEKYDTYKNGLNQTKNGKGENPGLSTLGFRFSQESRKKMSEAAKKRIERDGPTIVKHTEEQKQKWSEQRKGKYYGPRKLEVGEIQSIEESYLNEDTEFTYEDIFEVCKKTDVPRIRKEPYTNLKAKNGFPISYEILFIHKKAKEYNVTKTRIRQIVKNVGQKQKAA